MGVLSRFRAFDYYAHVPADLTEKTTTGGIGRCTKTYPVVRPWSHGGDSFCPASIACSAIIVYLLVTEFQAYLTIKTESEMYVVRLHIHRTTLEVPSGQQSECAINNGFGVSRCTGRAFE